MGLGSGVSLFGVRRKMAIIAYASKHPMNRKLTCNVDLLRWVRAQFSEQQDGPEMKEMWGAIAVAFFFIILHEGK